MCTRKISKAIYTILLVRFARFFIYIRHVILSFTSRERPFTISIHTPHSLLHYVQWPLDPTGPTHASLVVARIGTELPAATATVARGHDQRALHRLPRGAADHNPPDERTCKRRDGRR